MLAATFVPSPDAICQEVNGETVILDIRSEQYFSLDPVGTRVWQLLGNQDQLSVIYETLLSEYEVDGSTLQADLEQLMTKLLEEGLVMQVSENE